MEVGEKGSYVDYYFHLDKTLYELESEEKIHDGMLWYDNYFLSVVVDCKCACVADDVL